MGFGEAQLAEQMRVFLSNVILSEVGVRKANANAVEGPLCAKRRNYVDASGG